MRYFFITILFFISLVLQSTLFSHLTVAGVKPNLVLVLVVFYALFHGPKEGALAGLIGGLMQDMMFGQYIGLNALAGLVVGYLIGLLERKIYKESLFIPTVILFLSTFLHETILYILRLSVEPAANYFTLVKGVILAAAVYNSCLAPFIYGKFYRSSQKGLLRTTE